MYSIGQQFGEITKGGRRPGFRVEDFFLGGPRSGNQGQPGPPGVKIDPRAWD